MFVFGLKDRFSLNLKSTENAILLPPDDQQRPEMIKKRNDEQSDHCHRPSTLHMISESVCLAFYHQILLHGIIGRLDFSVRNILKNPPSYTITGLNSVCQCIIIGMSDFSSAWWSVPGGQRTWAFFPEIGRGAVPSINHSVTLLFRSLSITFTCKG
jgi:hypothetical protein